MSTKCQDFISLVQKQKLIVKEMKIHMNVSLRYSNVFAPFCHILQRKAPGGSTQAVTLYCIMHTIALDAGQIGKL